MAPRRRIPTRLFAGALIGVAGWVACAVVADEPDAALSTPARPRACEDAARAKSAADAQTADAGRGAADGAAAHDNTRGERHWSFAPITSPQPPRVRDEKWVRNAIDRFILAQLETRNLSPVPEADRYTLIRRATFDLTGLPPTPEEIVAFVKDDSPDAYEKLIGRLLRSPHYGERWGRHWLDVARYVPGKVKLLSIDRPDMAADYRDYVVRAFNTDKPYDRFIIEQLAGDLLPKPQRAEENEIPVRLAYFDQIIAPAFLSIGDWFDECTDPNKLRMDIIDEQMSTTSKAFMGINMGCVRCHDHKFDPIPTRDYYAMAGIFRSTRITERFSDFWRDGRPRLTQPMTMPSEVETAIAARADLEKLKKFVPEAIAPFRDHLMNDWSKQRDAFSEAVKSLPPLTVVRFEAEQFNGQDELVIRRVEENGVKVEYLESLRPLDRWVRYTVKVPEKGDYDIQVRYAADESSPIDLELNGQKVAEGALAEPTYGTTSEHFRWGSIVVYPFREGDNFIRIRVDKRKPFPLLDRFRLVKRDDPLEDRRDELADAKGLSRAALAEWHIENKQPQITMADLVRFEHRVERILTSIAQFQKFVDSTHANPILAVADYDKPTNVPVHLRGDVYQTAGDPVPRGALTAFNDLIPPPQVADDHSGRLELAKWLTDPRHPLTARVMVNRIWAWHFGRGIVATPSEFGVQGAPPTHPELLDWLASEFIRSGWSVKHIQKLIMLSSVYRMDSRIDAAAVRIDPDDTWLWRYPPHRLDAEAIYDAMLMAAGQMTPQEADGTGGPWGLLDRDASSKRALYVLTSGKAPPGLGDEIRKMLTLFDYDDTGVPIDQRDRSTTPAQALWWLNNPLPRFFADAFADRLLAIKVDDRRRAKHAHFVALNRPASEAWVDDALAYIDHVMSDEKIDRKAAWSRLCAALFATNGFKYIE